VAVSVGGHLNGGVAEALFDYQEVGALGDHQRSCRVAQIVKACPRIEVGAKHGRLEESLVEVVVTKWATAGSGKDEGIPVVLPSVDVVSQLASDLCR
jgi:hypothetical protein